MRTISGEHHVRVGIYEAGQHDFPARIQRSETLRQRPIPILHHSYPRDLSVLRQNSGIAQQSQVPHFRTDLCPCAMRCSGDKLGDILDEKIQCVLMLCTRLDSIPFQDMKSGKYLQERAGDGSAMQTETNE